MLRAPSSPSQRFAAFDRLFRIGRRGGHDVIGSLKQIGAGIFDTADLPARHGMRADELHSRGKQRLRLFHHAALYPRHVCGNGPFPQPRAIFVQPFQQNVRVKCKDNDVKLPHIIRIRLGAPVADETVFFSKSNGVRVGIDSADFHTLCTQGRGIAAADQAQPYDQNLLCLIQRHVSIPPLSSNRSFTPSAAISRKKSG